LTNVLAAADVALDTVRSSRKRRRFRFYLEGRLRRRVPIRSRESEVNLFVDGYHWYCSSKRFRDIHLFMELVRCWWKRCGKEPLDHGDKDGVRVRGVWWGWFEKLWKVIPMMVGSSVYVETMLWMIEIVTSPITEVNFMDLHEQFCLCGNDDGLDLHISYWYWYTLLTSSFVPKFS